MLEGQEGTSQTDIVRVTGIDRSTLAVLVKRWLRQGYFRRRRSKTDARAYVVRLTDNCRKVLDANRGAATRTDEHLFAPIAASHRAISGARGSTAMMPTQIQAARRVIIRVMDIAAPGINRTNSAVPPIPSFAALTDISGAHPGARCRWGHSQPVTQLGKRCRVAEGAVRSYHAFC